MKRIALGSIAFVVLAVGLFGAVAAADKSEKVKLRDGQSVSRSGEIKGNHTLTYSFAGKKGQSLSLNFFPTEGSCGFDLYSPGMAVPMFLGGSGAGAFSGKLPQSGDYGVKIRGGACSFEVTFRIRE